MNITKIEKLSYAEAQQMAVEEMEIKGHKCLFAELDDRFGYSVLVFKDGKHIYYANDYQLHHEYMVRESGKEALREWYIETLNNKLFTDEELLGNVSSYNEYSRKDYFLRNYWIMRYDYVSVFAISEEDRKLVEKGKKTHPYFNPVSFCYVKTKEIVELAFKYSAHLEAEYEKLKSNTDAFRKMVAYELANHEACITGSATATLESLGLKYEDLSAEQKEIVDEELKSVSN